MSVFTKLAQQIFAPVDENGNPRAISEQEAGVWGTEIERLILALGAGELDPEDLPPTWALASNSGAGTPNAIQATTVLPVTEAVFVVMNIAETNTASPVTVSFNGGAPLTIKTNSGNDPAPGGLVVGMIVLGIVSGAAFRLVSDQVSSAIVAAAEAAAVAAAAARDQAVAAAAGVNLPPVAADRMLVDNAAGTVRESLTFDQVKERWDPDAKLLHGDGYKITVISSEKDRPIGFFGTGNTAVGGGNAAVDTAALIASASAGYIVNLTGKEVHINQPIPVTGPGATFFAEKSSRVGANASSRIVVADNAMMQLFQGLSTNFEATGFFVDSGLNDVITLFHLQRPVGSPSDIDAELVDIGHEGGGRFFYCSGRGLKCHNIVSGNVKVTFGELDFPAAGDWTPNGQTNDTQATAMRAYQFHQLRLHGAAGGIRNTGANALNCGPIIGSDWLADIGGGPMFTGVSPAGSKFNNLVSAIGATIAGGLLDLWGGSKKTAFSNITAMGIKSGSDSRLNRTPIILRPTTANPIQDIKFLGGDIGPCNRNGIQILGSGECYVTIDGMNFDRTNIEGTAYSPIRVDESGGTLTDVWIKLNNSNFRFGGETPPTSIIGGLNSANVHVRGNPTVTRPAGIAWTQNLVDQQGLPA